MAERYSSIGFDGTNFRIEANQADGSVITTRIAVGTHTDQEFATVALNLRQAYAGLRQWSLDGLDAFNTWPTKTAAQKDATQREVIRRFGVLCDRLADFLLAQSLDR